MTTSWTFRETITIDGVDVSAALIKHSIKGAISTAIFTGPAEFVSRRLNALLTVTNDMPVVITRHYVVTVDGGEPSNVDQVIFRGYTLAPDASGPRTTIQVQDKLKLLADREVNKTYGTAAVPVDLSEIIYDIIVSAGLTATYNVTGATIQKSGVTTTGLVLAHRNSFAAVKDLVDSLGWQFYYHPGDDAVYVEPRDWRSTSKPTFDRGDYAGRPDWTPDVSQLCNKLIVLPRPTDNTATLTHVVTINLPFSAGQMQGIAVPRQAKSIKSVRWTSGGGGGNTAGTTGELIGMTADTVGLTPGDSRPAFGFVFDPSESWFPGYNLWIINNTVYGRTEIHDMYIGDTLEITYVWEGPVPVQYADAASIAAYGEKVQTIARSDLSSADAVKLAMAYIGRFSQPLSQVTIEAIHDPTKSPWLGQLCDIVDSGAGKSATDLAAVALTLKYPGNKDTLTLGLYNANTADYTIGLEQRIKQLEVSGVAEDYTQGQYAPLDGSGGEEEPGEGEPSTGGKVTVVSGVLTGPDGAAIHLRGVNDSATLADACNARGGDWVPSSTTSCPVSDSGTIDTSSAEEIAQFFYRYGLALLANGLNYVRLGAHASHGLDAFWTQYNADDAQYDKVFKSAAQGLESAGIYFSICMSGFAEIPVAEGGDGYFNRRLTVSQTTQGDHVDDSGYPTDNILHKDSTSYNYFAGLCTHTGDLVGDFPHFVALELSNEPNNWRHCPVYWTVIYGDDYSTGGAVETAMEAWGSGLAAKIRNARTKTWNLMNGWTPLVGPPYMTRATVLPITNPANLIRDLNEGMDIAASHVYHFSPIFCDSATPAATGNCDGTVCGQTNIHTAIKSACQAAGMPYLNNEWGRYCDSAQIWVQGIADGLDSLGVHHACIVPPSRYAIGSETLPDGWDDLPLVPAEPEPTEDDWKYLITTSGGTIYAKDQVGSTISSGSALHTVFNDAVAALTAGRTSQESIKVQGSFSLTGTMLPANYTTVIVDGTIAWGTAGAGYMIGASGKHHIEVRGGTWDGKKDSRPGIYSDGIPIYFENCDDLIIRPAYVHHACYDAIECLNCDRVLLQYSELAECYWDAIMMAWCNDCLVDACYIHDITQGGCYFYCEDDSPVDIAQTSNNNIVRGCRVERTLTSGISFSPRGAADTVSGGSIENNICVDCGTDGDHPAINVGYATKGQGTKVNDNQISCPAGLSGAGIEFGVDNGECKRNTITGAGENGIAITGNGNSVTGNDVRGCGTQAEFYRNVAITGDNNVVTGNTIGTAPNGSISNTGTGNTVSPNTIVA